MSGWRLALRLLRRDWQAGELHLLALALVLTVGAVTAVGLFGDRIEGAMGRQGGELLAADLAVDDAYPIPPSFTDQARGLGLATSVTLEFPSVVLAGDADPTGSGQGGRFRLPAAGGPADQVRDRRWGCPLPRWACAG